MQKVDWNAKVGSQETPGVTGKFGLGIWNEAGQRLTEFCQVNAQVIASTLLRQHKRRLYTWTSPDAQYQNQIYYLLCSQRWRALYSQVGEGDGTPLQYSCLENPMDTGAWWAVVHGVAKSRTRLK